MLCHNYVLIVQYCIISRNVGTPHLDIVVNDKTIVASLTSPCYTIIPLRDNTRHCGIIVITLYYCIRSFKRTIILLYVKRRFRVIVCQSQRRIVLRCLYDPRPYRGRACIIRADRKHAQGFFWVSRRRSRLEKRSLVCFSPFH